MKEKTIKERLEDIITMLDSVVGDDVIYVCSECGNELSVAPFPEDGELRMHVAPCEVCTHEAFKAGEGK